MKSLLSILIVISSILSIAHTTKLDSLYAELKHVPDNEEKAGLYNELGWIYLKMNMDSALYYAGKARDLSRDQELTAEEGVSFLIFGKAHLYMGRLNDAVQYYDSAKMLFSEAEVLSNLAEAYNRKGLCLQLLEEYEASQHAHDSALNYALAGSDTNQIIRTYIYLSGLLGYMEDYEESLKYMYMALDLIEIVDDNEQRIIAWLNLGNRYLTRSENDKALDALLKAAAHCEQSTGKGPQLNYCFYKIASVYQKTGDPQNAIKYAFKALEYKQYARVKANLVSTYSTLGISYALLDDYDNAIKYGLIALNLSQELDLPKMKADIQHDLGNIYLSKGDATTAIRYFTESMTAFENLENKFPLANTLQALADAYALQGDYENAWTLQKQHDELQDTLYSERNERNIQKLETEYKVKEQDALLSLQESELELKDTKLDRQRLFNVGIGVIAVLLLAVLLLAWFNIRKSKKINRQLKDLDVAKSRFFTNISHEMRNPLTLILAPLKGLSEKFKNTPHSNELELAYSNSSKLLERVNEILDLSKLDSGKMVLNETAVNLYNLCHRIFYAYESLAQYRNIEINFDFQPSTSLTVNIDVEKFEKILNNLILNAFKYSESDGRVSLEVLKVDERIKFSLCDTGKGIYPEDMQNIFNRYYQAEKRDDPVSGGTGVGLTLAKEYAKLFGGDIEVESKVGKGSVFTLRLPLKETDKKIAVDDELIHETDVKIAQNDIPVYNLRTGDKKPGILIVEDNLEISRYLENNLTEYYECTSAPDGVKALQALSKNQFGLIISDVMMPNMDGFEFREKVRENSKWRQYPFILLTARAKDEDKIKGFHLGVDDYITKPFNMNELLARISNLIKNKHERDKWRKENITEDESEEKITVEEQLLRKAEKFVLDNLDSSEMKVAELAAHIGYSQRQLERLLKKYSGFTPASFIREIRLQKAFQILEQRQFATIKEVCYEVGMDNPAGFTTSFKARFGKTPGEVGSRV